MKSATKQPTTPTSPQSLLVSVFLLLAFLMIATRGHHFSTFSQLPSASTAVFFIAGMYLRNLKSFWFFYILSIAIDLTSSYIRGEFGSCLTVSYPALAFSYAVMFAAGYYARVDWAKQSTLFNIAKVSFALVIASSLAFFISNGSYYAFSGNFPELSWAEYTTRVAKYYFRSFSNPIFYVVTAIVIDWTISKFLNTNVTATTQSEQ
ncbi:hypothetical protein [Thalassotalea profundi]|uniref:Uncharacterized protein n=1 Tax=Thalassotalea profundi TaxID=2036687 RepID=A0ABQ3IQQ8_9GAMM|nr:hypothetical protein [Thalassotalea profundi]GHE89028.1 hypothetical protein GCM10011501_18090 [Thalassotalea profundi]